MLLPSAPLLCMHELVRSRSAEENKSPKKTPVRHSRTRSYDDDKKFDVQLYHRGKMEFEKPESALDRLRKKLLARKE